VENWALTVPKLKIAAPATPADVVGLMAAAIRSDDPVVFFEHKGLFATKGRPRRRAIWWSWGRRPSRGRGPT
jgi:acetoin:2,6-dichlorophenolindophenol oxidoreductase subunit beta